MDLGIVVISLLSTVNRLFSLSESSSRGLTILQPAASLSLSPFIQLTPFSGGNPILEYYDLKMSKWGSLGIVFAFFCFWTFLAWFALAFMRHQQR